MFGAVKDRKIHHLAWKFLREDVTPGQLMGPGIAQGEVGIQGNAKQFADGENGDLVTLRLLISLC